MTQAVPFHRHPPAERSAGLRLSWRGIEWAGAALSVFLISGAVFPLMLMAASGELGERERGILRTLQLPVVGFAFAILLRHPGALLLAMRRTLPLVILVGLAFVSATWSIAPGISLRRAVALTASILLAYFFAIRFTPRQILLLFSVVVGTCLCLSLAAAVALPGLSWMPDGTGLRGVYSHKNVLGWASSMGVVLSLGLLVDPDRRLRRGGAALLAVSLGCLIPSGSSTGVMASVTALILTGVFATLARGSGVTRAVVILMLLQAAGLLLLSLGTLLVPLLEHLGRDATLTGRVPLWALLDAYIAERPWLGYGYGAFWSDDNPRTFAIIDALGWTPPHGHSGYRDMILSLGAVGAGLLALALISGVRRAARLHRAQPGEGWGWMSASIGVMLMMNLSETNFLAQNDIQWLLLATVLAAVALRGGPGDG